MNSRYDPVNYQHIFCTVCPFQVYGTSNIRVADLSVVPLQIATPTLGVCAGQKFNHLLISLFTATAYAIGMQGESGCTFWNRERLTNTYFLQAADIIQEKIKHRK